ncbi:Rne/Rng family ribonuclease [Corynebacterium sp. SCR221107]|uniref:translation initiation factor IF-2 N-terminal domain-containing protein n=1 Tax=Corynebacterium sp. SCR221107 TaxID=3017361 RepID=UPI0022EC58EF|nr:Rne/Rng family ribonuclease [Corynebacterium sp. SCR221107]WBT10101.1 Rne/Rng family ribonuclease [Corynebacterium sp. SCR221107]
MRKDLPAKLRVSALAKQLGVATKEVVAVLAAAGVDKVAQSNITAEQATLVLDAYAPANPATSEQAVATNPEADEQRLRYRVRKNVDNEIAQIEDKVNRELGLAASADPQPAEEPIDEDKLRHRVEKNVDNEIHQIEEKVERDIEERLGNGLLVGTDEHDDDFDFGEESAPELLEDVTPAITPAPNEPTFATPLFLAPTLVETPSEDEAFDDEEEDDLADQQPRKRRRGRRGTGRGRGVEDAESNVEEANVEEADDAEPQLIDEPLAIKGSTRLEAQRRRRVELREESRKKRHVVSEAEFLARRESVKRTMVVRERERTDHPGLVTQVGVLEDDMLVEHFVTSDTQSSMVGNIYLGRVQNVLPSMEAAFIDIGKGRNGVLYAGEVNWRKAGLGGKNRRIEQALKSGDQVLVQVSKDPVGHKGARLTTQISLAGRYLVYVPGGRSAGISRKLPVPERKRLKEILRKVVPGDGGVIIRTAAEGVSEEAIAADVGRLHTLWEQIQERTSKETESKGAKPVTMYEEPNMLVKVVRDLFNEDFHELVVDGKRAWNTVHAYIQSVAPELAGRLTHFDRDANDGRDAFEVYRVDEQIQKALSRKVWLPSGGTLVIDRTEAMTVIDVNTGKFTGAGGNLEETVTRNNLEAAEEIVRQMRLRDLGGMIVVDFIDMVLPENQDLVLRRLKETLGRDRTRHQISEVTSLGLVQMTRKRLGTGLLETFATECEHCEGRGVIIHADPVEHTDAESRHSSTQHGVRHQDPTRHPAVVAMHNDDHGAAREDEPEPAKPSIEELAAAVVPEDQPEKEVSRPRKRRRGSRAGHAPATDEAMSVSAVEEIAHAAVATANEHDPDAPSGADYLPASHAAQPTYEQALAEFEASPRRKRRVRGNSASDVPPKPEDFQGHEAPHSEHSESTQEVKAETTRARKRARRSTAASESAAQQVPPAGAAAKEPTQEISTSSRPGSNGRTRRRAVRRAVTASPVQEHKDVGRSSTRPVETAVNKSEASSGRGRRRAVRRRG